jgi:hypothetical protein
VVFAKNGMMFVSGASAMASYWGASFVGALFL